MTSKHDIIKFRRGTAAEWEASEPQPGGEVLKLGEPGYEKDTGKLKIGDGVTPWNSLGYVSGGAGIIVVEDIDHLINDVIQAGSGIALNFDDSNDTLTISTTGLQPSGNYSLVGHTHFANEIIYDNTLHTDETHGLTSTNVQDAIDELEYKKVNVSDLNTNLILFPTTAVSDVLNHNRMVTTTTDTNYDTGASNVSTGTISSNDQLVGQLISDAGIINGDVGLVNLTTIGNIRKVSGNKDAGFYFKVFKLYDSSIETEICSSDPTPSISSSSYQQFSESALFPTNTSFVLTDRIIIRYYAVLTGTGNDPVYEFQFGGTDPVRTLIPVPANVVVRSVWTQDINNNIYYNDGNVGIATTSPNYTLDVNGSGNFASGLYVNSIPVSTSGHTHTASDITDFNTSVSGLLPTIANSGDNRLLTSDGTSTGINAESNFTYNPDNGITNIYTSGINNTLLLSQNSSDTIGQSPRINFRKNRGTSDSPTPLQSGDFIGSVFWTTINASGINSTAAQIGAYTVDGLSSYNDTPTQFRISNRTKDGSFSHIYIYDDGTVNPTAGMILNDNAKSIAFGNTRSTALQIFNSTSLEQNETSEGSLSWSLGTCDVSSTYNSVSGGSTLAFMTIPSGISNSGVLVGHNVAAYRNGFTSDDNGDLSFVVGQSMIYGHAWGDSTTTNTAQIRGISMAPAAGAGTIQSCYDIFLGNTIYDIVIDASGTIKEGTGTISSRYGIYQESADPNVLSGSLTVDNGLSAPTKIHNLGTVSGNVSINYDIDKQIQTLTLDGTATNFIEGSGWNIANKSMDVFLEITVTNTTTVTWTLIDDQYNPFPSFTSGKYLVLLRSIGSTIQGHYIGKKTN